jgi:ABC-type transport system involved in multi-copper enzyme maturation permease subunit
VPVFEQGYRPYVGPRLERGRALAIAWENVRPRMRWWLWVLLFVMLFHPYLVYATIIFVVTAGQTLLGTGARGPMLVAPTNVAFESNRNLPGQLLGMVQGGDPMSLVWELLNNARWAVIVIPAVTCSGLLASDRRTGALQIYFARPVTRLHYVVGKVLAATAFVALTTAIPCLLLWLETLVFGSAANFTWRTWVAPFSILGTSCYHALWATSLVLALSSTMKRPAFVAIVAVFTFVLMEGTGAILGQTLSKSWKVLQPSVALGAIDAPLCGMSLPDWVNVPAAYGLGFLLPLALMAFVVWRVRAVEVVT